MRNGRVGREGFTLIELLVVIGIIAVLAAIVLPVYNGAQEKARQSQCKVNLNGIVVAIKMYRNDHRRYPLGALGGNVDNLPDAIGGGNNAYTGAAYNTFDQAGGRKSRVNALFPNYIEEQKSLICPDEDGDTYLISGDDPAAAYNSLDSTTLLSVGGNPGPSFAASTYDDFYNVFGYHNDSSGTVSLGPGTPVTLAGNQVSGGRKAPRLNNPYAPGSTIITYCREHEEFYKGDSVISLAVRLGGSTETIVRKQYGAESRWSTQAEQVYD